MNSQDMEPQSGERLSFFQLISKKRLRVEIPIIQRDYAQGRPNQKAVRTAFLDALYGYLQKGTPLRDLDFVYGSIVANNSKKEDAGTLPVAGRFVPLDGQQRLTTLFLLHWYLAQISGQTEFLRSAFSIKGHSLFTYETRNSSSEFCDAMIANDIRIDDLLCDETGSGSIAATIEDAGWFYLSWSSDPTIRSMLIMLDAIHDRFEGCKEFFDLLVDDEAPVITFLFLNLQEFKLTDDLYIKMNARGKPLTQFENFKARLEKKVKSFNSPWPEYRLEFQDGPVSGYEYFIHKIDTDWADLFWSYRNETLADNTYDDELMNFMALVIANFHILDQNLERGLFGSGGSLKRWSFMEYDQLNCLSQNLIVHLISMFDLLHRGNLSQGKLTPYLEPNPYYSEEETFRAVIRNTTSYPEKLRFYGFYRAVENGLRGDELSSWMRVIFNLTENTIINTLDDYYLSLESIRDLAEQGTPVLELLRRDVDVDGFIGAQITEEKVKAHLIDKSSEWLTEVLSLENHSFFRGQVGFVLKFSGIVDYYLEHGNTGWGEADQQNYLDEFRRYARSASAVFSVIGVSSSSIDYAWERAVLTKGDYLTTSTADRFNLLSTRLAKNNIERDHSWKRLLRLPYTQGSPWDQRQSHVRSVFDDPNFDTDDIQGSLDKICEAALETLQVVDWRSLLISTPALFKICNQGFIVKNNNEVVLLHESQRNHYHSELYSKFLELRLEADKVNSSPFQLAYYHSDRGADALTYICFSGFRFEDREYQMKVWYQDHQYQFLFSTTDGNSCSSKVTSALEHFGFGAEKGLDDHPVWYLSRFDSPGSAQEAVTELCALLRGLADN
ncbi:DUF262 domain-containing protein [Marinobacter salarius]|uniref:DUF262 domain-containing protein n=1 Tax=Marinobacter salarius TaxID=1420917 RepID=UPI001D182B30|nr:DUF262 domain-containing protein [Marinobacter salarius]MCC4284855.1 DUF262 domain-containing protein [Marinobacter salarius]